MTLRSVWWNNYKWRPVGSDNFDFHDHWSNVYGYATLGKSTPGNTAKMGEPVLDPHSDLTPLECYEN